jgi:hypothetical protein
MTPAPPRPVRVDPLLADLGTIGGQRLVLLSLEVYAGFADLRFARVDVGATSPLPRRVPATAAWEVTGSDGVVYAVVDCVGRGDRHFSNGEARLVPAPEPGSTLDIRVGLVGSEPAHAGRVVLGGG